MRISLDLWAKRNFDPAPHRNTLRKWRQEGRIAPAPVFIGRGYFVEENARYLADPKSAPRRPDLRSANKERYRRKDGKPTLLDRLEAEEARAKR